eukprot:GHVN01080315.1.p1 GENE.GHVN01080315.1~~GHVN01080315.1.p1  ORF type:complete len:108 (-),score=8.38 GHVN01080315.1:96-419(-)
MRMDTPVPKGRYHPPPSHSEVRDALGDLLALAIGRQVTRESKEDDKGLRADLAVRGRLYEPQEEALIDIRVTDTDAQYLSDISMAVVTEEQAKRKHTKYDQYDHVAL